MKSINTFNLEELSSSELVEINGGVCPPKAPVKNSAFATLGCGLAVVVHEIGEAVDDAVNWVKNLF